MGANKDKKKERWAKMSSSGRRGLLPTARFMRLKHPVNSTQMLLTGSIQSGVKEAVRLIHIVRSVVTPETTAAMFIDHRPWRHQRSRSPDPHRSDYRDSRETEKKAAPAAPPALMLHNAYVRAYCDER